MTRPLLFLAATIVAAATVAPATAEGNVNFVLGGRSMTDDANWKPFESQDAFGANVDFGRPSWPIHLETGIQGSSKMRNIAGTDVTATASEVFFGVNKTWNVRGGKAHPYVGGGVAAVNGSFDTGGVTVDDTSGGVYVHGGIYWRIGHRFNIGLDLRALGGSKLTFFGQDLNANYTQGGLVLGWGWPRS